MILKTLPILAAAMSLAAIAPAHAQDYESYDQAPSVGEVIVVAPSGAYGGGRELKSEPVVFSDLDLDNIDGGYTLLTRIRSAARDVCSPVAEMRNLADTSDFQRCVRRAVDHAVNEVGAPTVQDAYYDVGVGTADLPN